MLQIFLPLIIFLLIKEYQYLWNRRNERKLKRNNQTWEEKDPEDIIAKGAKKENIKYRIIVKGSKKVGAEG